MAKKKPGGVIPAAITNDPRTYPEQIRECWATHEALRTLGFAPDDIYVVKGTSAQHPLNPPALFVVLKTQDKEFVVTIGLYVDEGMVDEALDQWAEFATRFNEKVFGEEAMKEVFESSSVCRNKTMFVTALLGKGIRCPFAMN